MSLSHRLDFTTVSRLTQLADYIIPFTLAIVADLGVADHLTSGPLSIEEIASRTNTHKQSLLVAMRGLASKGIFQETQEQVFELTPMGQYLRSDHPYSLRDSFAFQEPDATAWSKIGHTLRTGEPAFQYVHEKPFWRFMADNHEHGLRFDASQDAMTRLELPLLQRFYPWDRIRTAVDVGGGNGALIGGLLTKNPSLSGTLFDLPHVVAGAHARLSRAGVADRCTLVPGSFLEGPIPPGADVYMMKRVLWGHQDDEAERLLMNVRAAMRPDSELLVIEPTRTERAGMEVANVVDLKLLALGGAGSRSAEQFQTLFARVGLQLVEVIPAVLTAIVRARPIAARPSN